LRFENKNLSLLISRLLKGKAIKRGIEKVLLNFSIDATNYYIKRI